MTKELRNSIDSAPLSPGCYIFRNKHSDVIYVGKSKALRQRLKQHLVQKPLSGGFDKHVYMLAEAAQVECIVTDTETDALILEYTLIKQYLPRYNSQYNSEYLGEQPLRYIIIGIDMDYPTVYTADAPPECDEAKVLGCFYSIGDTQAKLELICEVWQMPHCNRPRFPPQAKPCMNYHIKKCCAPCAAKVPREVYARKISEITACFSGDCAVTLQKLQEQMLLSAKALDFERAARLKSQIDGVTALAARAKRVAPLGDEPFFLFIRAYNEPACSLAFISQGNVLAWARIEGKACAS
ncbi:MAG: GIY-YIG nuclease family protein, partial [Defluviitaleaceae bacterium]|nr:GIY-YIG nuclease family protein [Defluviitaleaceae bacterium]